MRVRIRVDGHGRAWVDPDRDYLVLDVYATERGVFLVVLTDDGFPAAIPEGSTEVVDGRIPPGWVVGFGGTRIEVGPPAFRKMDFWNQFWDDRGPGDDGTWVEPIYRKVVVQLVDAVGTDADRAAVDAMPRWGERD